MIASNHKRIHYTTIFCKHFWHYLLNFIRDVITVNPFYIPTFKIMQTCVITTVWMVQILISRWDGKVEIFRNIVFNTPRNICHGYLLESTHWGRQFSKISTTIFCAYIRKKSSLLPFILLCVEILYSIKSLFNSKILGHKYCHYNERLLYLTHCCRETLKGYIGKQCRPKSDAAQCSVWSGSPLGLTTK